ncbi:exonuclease SbcCD subunit D, partial [Floccifex sp.]|uniref:exonuclease SbcCD subunit D n=1 Tax=Floccifex sp. TaxID=2815810 RepID=UPI003F01DD44
KEKYIVDDRLDGSITIYQVFMRLFHISDLHLGIRLMNYELIEDQNDILLQIVQYIQQYQPDCLLIAGDIYDKSIPSTDAIEQYNAFLNAIRKVKQDIAILVIAGNHDSGLRINQYQKILSLQKVYTVGSLPIQKIDFKDVYGPYSIYLFPFVRPSHVKQYLNMDIDESLSYDKAIHLLLEQEKIDETQRNILVSHQLYLPPKTDISSIERSESEIQTVGNIDVVYSDCLQKFDYVALGHIHKPMTVKEHYIRYAGSIFPYSISEQNQTKQILMVDIKEKGYVSIQSLPLKPKRNIRTITGFYEDIISQNSDDYVRIELLDQKDLNFIDMQEKIRSCFPHVLEIQRKYSSKLNYDMHLNVQQILNPFELICEFIQDVDEQDKEIIQKIINEIGGME